MAENQTEKSIDVHVIIITKNENTRTGGLWNENFMKHFIKLLEPSYLKIPSKSKRIVAFVWISLESVELTVESFIDCSYRVQILEEEIAKREEENKKRGLCEKTISLNKYTEIPECL